MASVTTVEDALVLRCFLRSIPTSAGTFEVYVTQQNIQKSTVDLTHLCRSVLVLFIWLVDINVTS